MSKISIIMPVYNAALYLESALDSLCKQTYKNLQILCVNDCSTDHSLAILEKYADKDSRITIISLDENKGQGYARNRALEHVSGQYIGFMDSDDSIDPQYFEYLIDKSKAHDADIVSARVVVVNEQGHVSPARWLKALDNSPRAIYSLSDRIEYIYDRLNVCVYKHLFKQSFIAENGIEFLSGHFHEDQYFMAQAFYHANKIVFADHDSPVYYYYQRPHSSMHQPQGGKKHAKVLLDQMITLKQIILFFKDRNLAAKDLESLYDDFYKIVSAYSLKATGDLKLELNLNALSIFEKQSSYYQSIESSIDKMKYDYYASRVLSNKEYPQCSTDCREIYDQEMAYPDVHDEAFIVPLSHEPHDYAADISIVIAVERDARFLHQCLDSIVNQSLSSIEIICVFDGKDDAVFELLREYDRKDKRVVLIHQGQGDRAAAYNAAMRLARADYIAFAHADDYLEANALEIALEPMRHDPSIDYVSYLAKIIKLDCDEDTIKAVQDYHAIKLLGRQAVSDHVLSNSSATSWNKLFKARIIKENKIEFPINRRWEDRVFFYLYFACSHHGFYIPQALYHYRLRESSLVWRPEQGHLREYMDSLADYKTIFDYYRDKMLLDRYSSSLARFFYASYYRDFGCASPESQLKVLRFANHLLDEMKISSGGEQLLKKIDTSIIRGPEPVKQAVAPVIEKAAPVIEKVAPVISKGTFLFSKMKSPTESRYRFLGISIFEVTKHDYYIRKKLFGIIFYKKFNEKAYYTDLLNAKLQHLETKFLRK